MSKQTFLTKQELFGHFYKQLDHYFTCLEDRTECESCLRFEAIIQILQENDLNVWC